MRDVVVVGGGPAGSAVAARMAAAGHDVLVLDREAFPRSKPCGECVNPAAVRALAELGALPLVLAAPHARLAGWRIEPHPGAPFAGAFPAGGEGIGIARSRFDAILLDFARGRGAEVRTGARVAELLREGSRVAGVRLAGGEEIRARLVIGADGLRSVVVRRLGLLRRSPRLRKVALTAHLRGLSRLGSEGELHLFPWGCMGVAAVGGGEANVTVVASGAEVGRLRGAREAYFDAVLADSAALRGAGRVSEVLATGPFDCPTRRAIADGALLVGDAAGYYDPFTGQGIYRALRGAELAADAADGALRSGDLSAAALEGYEKARRRAFGPGERLQHLIEGFIARPRLLEVVAGRFSRRPALVDALIAVTGDLRPVRSLLQPRLLAALLA
jgi:flavin-dependent dehydrogenase